MTDRGTGKAHLNTGDRAEIDREPPEPPSEEAKQLAVTQAQARRYLQARYGASVWYAAPETFNNVLERWIWAVAGGDSDLADQCINEIEEHFGNDAPAPGDDHDGKPKHVRPA
jgi:hypothetical protein